MAKVRTAYFCTECGGRHDKWQGQCKSCAAWNTLQEEVISTPSKENSLLPARGAVNPVSIHAVESIGEPRFVLPDSEMNRVLGGGIVPGSLILLGGEPGIGKSTLLLQLGLQMKGSRILYVSGEESERQIKMRAERLPFANADLFVLCETKLEDIIRQVSLVQPVMIIIDSIQTMQSANIESAPGSVSQVRDCATAFLRLAKEQQIPVFLVGHLTKDGMLAGPKVLEHMVDTVLSFEGDRQSSYRIVRTSKNRFGPTFEMGIYEMVAEGLREVSNPSELFLTAGGENFSGVAISATLEGLRPLLVETQALVTDAAFGNAQRSATGYDSRRLHMLLAVLEKKVGFKLASKDVFLNITGGIRIEDPAIDLGVAVSIVSSLHDLPVERKNVFAAEVGLTGEIRPVSRTEQRIAEAEKLGFEHIFTGAPNNAALQAKFPGIQVHSCTRLQEVFAQIFG